MRGANPPKKNNKRGLGIPTRPWDLDRVVPWRFGGFFPCASNHLVSILLLPCFFTNSNRFLGFTSVFLHSRFLLGDICRFSGYLKSLNICHRRHKSRKKVSLSVTIFPPKSLFRRPTYITKVSRRNGARTKTIPFRRFFSRLNVFPTEETRLSPEQMSQKLLQILMMMLCRLWLVKRQAWRLANLRRPKRLLRLLLRPFGHP